MRYKSLVVIIFVLAFLSFGCSSAPVADKVSNPGNSNQVNSNQVGSSDPAAQVNSETGEVDPNAQPAPGSLMDKMNQKKRLLAESNAATPSGPPPPPPPLRFEAAPEDSKISISMNSAGMPQEIRIFNSHPQLAKAEVIWDSPTEKTLKISLRNGRVVNLKTDKIGSLKTASSVQILELAGIKPPQNTTKADRSRIADEKKSDQ